MVWVVLLYVPMLVRSNAAVGATAVLDRLMAIDTFLVATGVPLVVGSWRLVRPSLPNEVTLPSLSTGNTWTRLPCVSVT